MPSAEPILLGTWQLRAACRPEVFGDPDIFYPPRARTGHSRAANEAKRQAIIAEAKAVCWGVPDVRPPCPVRVECLEWANTTRQTEGIWGGLTPEERGVTELR